jgi:hypothetical protein
MVTLAFTGLQNEFSDVNKTKKIIRDCQMYRPRYANNFFQTMSVLIKEGNLTGSEEVSGQGGQIPTYSQVLSGFY